jgi:phosphoribosylformimino-5-aminoimidazole carboxamide ribotide isomerase
MRGQVVHAVRGNRQAYQPLRSQLCEGSDVLTIVTALMALHPFTQFYIADLDAITAVAKHRNTVMALAAQYPTVQWWLDDGSSTPWHNKPINVLQVLGTESYPKLETFDTDFVLSLDERNGQLLGDAHLHQHTQHWPQRMIAMTLAQVGSDSGPNYARLRQYCTKHPSFDWYAAGGVRHVDDLHQLQSMGVRGALVATALHNGRITANELKLLEQT